MATSNWNSLVLTVLSQNFGDCSILLKPTYKNLIFLTIYKLLTIYENQQICMSVSLILAKNAF